MSAETETSTSSEKPANVYKTSKTTWIILGIIAVVMIIVVILLMKKGKSSTGEGSVGSNEGASNTEAAAEMRAVA